jgi:hypothetical protein
MSYPSNFDNAYGAACQGETKAEKQPFNTQCEPPRQIRRTAREEAEQQSAFHADRAAKQERAAAFFSENPAFDEFISLIRSGAVQI